MNNRRLIFLSMNYCVKLAFELSDSYSPLSAFDLPFPFDISCPHPSPLFSLTALLSLLLLLLLSSFEGPLKLDAWSTSVDAFSSSFFLFISISRTHAPKAPPSSRASPRHFIFVYLLCLPSARRLSWSTLGVYISVYIFGQVRAEASGFCQSEVFCLRLIGGSI